MCCRTITRPAVTLAMTVALSLGGVVVTAGTANAAGVCGPDMRWPGNAGEVVAQIGPTGYIQWGAKDYVDNSGLWQAWVMVADGRSTTSSRPTSRTAA